MKRKLYVSVAALVIMKHCNQFIKRLQCWSSATARATNVYVTNKMNGIVTQC